MRLLVAEDDPKLCDVLARGLERAGYVLDIARRGDEAFALLQHNNYACCIVDWRMPGMDGVELISAARRRGMRTPMLMLTARDTPADRIAGLDAGGDDYLVKPFDFGELLARIRALLRRPLRAPDALTVGSLVVEPALHQARCGGDELGVTPIEYSLLELLARRASTVVPRRELIRHAWPDAIDGVGSNTVEVHVARLRAKIARCDVVIVSVRRAGYRLDRR
ncbi:MAG: response regulator transcription factor [Candidatus Dormibacteraeota bacterium]|nr:response regulator transcription factor [Candidatus Dormibacteraeota bacterium]